MIDKNRDTKLLQNFYLSTYGEEIEFDDVRQKGHYLIALKRQEKERFLKGAGGIENERNSTIYYLLDTSSKTDMRMTIASETETEIPFRHYDKISKTSVTIYQGKNKLFDFGAFSAYIDTNDASQVSSFLTGRHLGAEYYTSSPETNDLFIKWHDRHESAIDAELSSDTRDIYHKYLTSQGKELRKGLLKAKDLFDICTDKKQPENVLERLRTKLADRHNIVKMCSKPRQVLGGKAFVCPNKHER